MPQATATMKRGTRTISSSGRALTACTGGSGGILTNISTSAAIALSGISVPHFWFALVLLGVGWNFLYIGGTTLIAEACAPAERAKTQGANDSIIFLVMATSSFSSGVLVTTNGWQILNYAALPFITAAAAGVLWLLLKRRRAMVAA